MLRSRVRRQEGISLALASRRVRLARRIARLRMALAAAYLWSPCATTRLASARHTGFFTGLYCQRLLQYATPRVDDAVGGGANYTVTGHRASLHGHLLYQAARSDFRLMNRVPKHVLCTSSPSKSSPKCMHSGAERRPAASHHHSSSVITSLS